MLRKKISKLMALVMTLTSAVSAVPAAEAKEGFVADGYEIIDAAYGNGTYVVMAKNLGVDKTHPTKIYTSTDKKHWTETQSAANGYRWGSPNSKQNVLYWQQQNVFVASIGNTVYTSSNGISWNENADLKTGYAMIDEKDGTLVLIDSNGGSTRAALSLSEIGEKTDSLAFYPTVMAAGDTTDGVTGYFMAGTWENYRRMKNLSQGKTSSEFDGGIVDAKFVPSMDGWLVLTMSKTISNIANTETAGFKRFSVTINGEAPEYNFSALGVNNDTVFVGDTNGGIYTMAAPKSATSENQTLIEVAPTAGTDAITEKVTDFVSIDENTFFVTTATGVYTLNKNGDAWTYSDCLKYTDIESAKVSASSFNGIKLLAGAYSPDLGIYAAIGNDQNSRSHIFYSEDGVDWTMSNVTTAAASTTAKNIAVWWPAQQCFVISNATMQLNGAVWTSTDGKTWKYNDKLGFGNNGDIQVLGDYLYSAHYSSKRAIKRYANLTDKATTIYYALKANEIEYNMNTIALSDDETPYVFAGGSSGGLYTVAPTSLNDDVEGTGRAYIDNKNANSKMIDAHWNKTINKFVAVNPVQKNIYMFSKDKTWESLPVNAEAGTLAAIETNGSSYLTGDVNGNLFFTNGTDLSKAKKFSKVDCLGATANTMPVTNIFTGADGKYIVTVSDGTTSDVLIVNSDGSGYVKASEESRITSIKGGDEFTVSVKVANYGETAQTVRLIAAIYDKSGTKLLQMVSDDKTMALNSTQYLELPVTANEDIPADATLKVFIWNSLGAMVPLTNGDNFF